MSLRGVDSVPGRDLIPKEEFEERRRKCAEAAGERGLDAMLVWSRGNRTTDRCANVLYLANHYAQLVYFPDHPPYWMALGHCAVVLPRQNEESVLISDLDYRNELAAIDDFRANTDVIGEVVEVIQEKKLGGGRIGIAGTDELSMKHYAVLRDKLPDAEFVPADDILNDLKKIKSKNEIRVIRQACDILNQASDIGMDAIQPGVREEEIVALITREFLLRGADAWRVGPCSSRVIRKGELYPLAIVGNYKFYHFDIGRTKVVGAEPTEEQARLLEVCTDFVLDVTKEIRPGKTAQEVAEFGFRFLEERLNIKLSDIKKGLWRRGPYTIYWTGLGHSLGLDWESCDPFIFDGDNTKIEQDMFLAIEMVLTQEGVGTAEVEHNFLVTETGTEVLTKL